MTAFFLGMDSRFRENDGPVCPAAADRLAGVMLKNCEHFVSPNVFASWAKATGGFRVKPEQASKR
jgi:hypothetical protein